MEINLQTIEQGNRTTTYIPISSNSDFTLVTIFVDATKLRDLKHHKRFMYELALVYNHKVFIRDIIDVEGFIAILKCFIDRKLQVEENNNFFIVKEKNKIKSLQFFMDKMRYISITEAMQMYKILTHILSSYDLTYVYDEFIMAQNPFVSTPYSKKYRRADNSIILDFEDYTHEHRPQRRKYIL